MDLTGGWASFDRVERKQVSTSAAVFAQRREGLKDLTPKRIEEFFDWHAENPSMPKLGFTAKEQQILIEIASKATFKGEPAPLFPSNGHPRRPSPPTVQPEGDGKQGPVERPVEKAGPGMPAMKPETTVPPVEPAGRIEESFPSEKTEDLLLTPPLPVRAGQIGYPTTIRTPEGRVLPNPAYGETHRELEKPAESFADIYPHDEPEIVSDAAPAPATIPVMNRVSPVLPRYSAPKLLVEEEDDGLSAMTYEELAARWRAKRAQAVAAISAEVVPEVQEPPNPSFIRRPQKSPASLGQGSQADETTFPQGNEAPRWQSPTASRPSPVTGAGVTRRSIYIVFGSMAGCVSLLAFGMLEFAGKVTSPVPYTGPIEMLFAGVGFAAVAVLAAVAG